MKLSMPWMGWSRSWHARKRLCAAGRCLARSGQVCAGGGNISIRGPKEYGEEYKKKNGGKDGFWISARGQALDAMTPSGVVWVDCHSGMHPGRPPPPPPISPSGQSPDKLPDELPRQSPRQWFGKLSGQSFRLWPGKARKKAQKSSEWRLHRDIYGARDDVGAIVHTHAPWASALACRRQGIEALHYTVAMGGADTIPCADYAPFASQALSDVTVAALKDTNACLLANHGMVALGQNIDRAVDMARMVESLAQITILARMGGSAKALGRDDVADLIARFGRYRRGQSLD